jgi:hypothetical protein
MQADVWPIGAAAAAMFFSLCATTALGQCYLWEYEFQPHGEPGDYFGYAVAYQAPYKVVGAPRCCDPPNNAPGAVWLSWLPLIPYTPEDVAHGDYFGASVDLDAGIAVIGAPYHDIPATNAGAAYVYSVGLPEKKLTASDLPYSQHFGASVAVSGDTIIVGAPYTGEHGAAYIFQRDHGGPDNWGEVARIMPGRGRTASAFGKAVTIDGDRVAVGAPHANQYRGDVRIFERDAGGPDNWGQVAVIAHPGEEDLYHLGLSVALEGDTLVIGATDHSIQPWGGAAYIFQRMPGDRDEWEQVVKLVPSQLEIIDVFGTSVAISGDTVLVGAPSGIDGGCWGHPGAVWVFRRDHGGPDAWGEIAKIDEQEAEISNWLGHSVSVDGDLAVAGAPACPEDPQIGKAFLLGISTCICTGDINYDRSVDTEDLLALLAAWGDSPPPHDINGDGVVNVADLLELLSNWGPCPG